jgi:hypothetical protein
MTGEISLEDYKAYRKVIKRRKNHNEKEIQSSVPI